MPLPSCSTRSILTPVRSSHSHLSLLFQSRKGTDVEREKKTPDCKADSIGSGRAIPIKQVGLGSPALSPSSSRSRYVGDERQGQRKRLFTWRFQGRGRPPRTLRGLCGAPPHKHCCLHSSCLSPCKACCCQLWAWHVLRLCLCVFLGVWWERRPQGTCCADQPVRIAHQGVAKHCSDCRAELLPPPILCASAPARG